MKNESLEVFGGYDTEGNLTKDPQPSSNPTGHCLLDIGREQGSHCYWIYWLLFYPAVYLFMK
jgi:hypothetical protein